MSLPIFGDQVTEERGENARLSAFVGALAVGDLLKTTLGPKGMDKMLQSASKPNEMLITNDGATILQAIPFNNPAAKVLVNISKVQDEEVGDGTTTVAVFAVELLREAEKLIEKRIHPQTIVDGYQRARNTALEALERAATDRSANADAFREELMSIARTTLSSKILSEDKELFAKIAVDAVLRLKGDTNLEHIQVIKVPGGKLSDSYLDDGFLLEKKFGVGQPKRLENPKILVANTPMDTDKVKIFGAKFRVDSTAKLAELERAEKEKMRAKVNKILAHKCDIFVNRQLIYNWPEQLFCDAGVNTIEHADFVGIERLALVTGAEVVSTFDAPEKVKYGHCESVEEVSVGDKTMLRFNGVAKGQACSVILRGATEAVLGEAERALHDALSVLSQTVVDPRVVLGGGSSEMVMSRAVDLAANRDDGKRALAIEAFARALRQLPTILADNAGLDSSELVAKLRAAVYSGNNNAGLDLDQGCVVDSRENGTLESYKLKKSAVSSATEAATLLLRVDNIIRAKPRTADRNH